MCLLGLAGGAAIAQSPVCAQIRAELAQLGDGAPRDSSRLRGELARVQLALRQNDCTRSGFLFFGAPPPVCGPLRAQANALAAEINRLDGGGASGQRRAQLVAALDRYGCLAQARPTPPGVIYANPGLFGEPLRDNPGPPDGFYPNDEPRERLGGQMAICVRTCDGFFFPVNFEGIGARDEYAQVCQSLCPAVETQVYFMPPGADLERAATRDGQPYMSLPAAKAYQKKLDPACTCKPPGQTWASAMRGVEDLVERRKGDIVVTREQAEASARPRTPTQTPPTQADRRGRKPEPPGDGKVADPAGPDGKRRPVRNVAPGLTGREPRLDLKGAAAP